MKDISRDNAGVIAPPPLIYVGSLLLSLFLHARVPLPLAPQNARKPLARILIGSAGAITSFALFKIKKAGTHVDPTQPTTALVVEGPYRFTRNPLYLSLTLVYTAIAMLLNTLWAILLLPVVLVIINRGVIDREEAYLTRKFGKQYEIYKAKVHRWL